MRYAPLLSQTITVLLACAHSATIAQFTTLHTGPAGSSLEAIQFPTPLVGYAVGKDGAAYKSINGGLDWTALNSGSGAYLFGVSFLNADAGFASGGGAAVLKTIDGGTVWAPLDMPFTECVYQVIPINDTLIVASGWGGYFFRSMDGGSDWSMEPIDPEHQGWVFGMDFLNADTGFVAEADGRIYRTDDGGASWTQSTTSTANTLRGISIPNASTGWAAGFFGTVQKSTDGGETWGPVDTGYPGDSYHGVHFTDADHGVICGGYYADNNWQGVIMRTDNGGDDWSRIHTGGPVLNGITVHEGSIFAVGVNEVIISDVLSTPIGSLTNDHDVRCCPNPATDRVRIELPSVASQEPYTVEVFNTTGALIHSERTTQRLLSINTTEWACGTYAVRAIAGDQPLTGALVIVRH